MPKVDLLITRAFPTVVVEPYEPQFSVAQGSSAAYMSRADLLRRIAEVRGIISSGADRVDDELLERGNRLEIVAHFGVGYDNIDLASATRRGIWVANTPDVVTQSTADIALLLLIATLRRAGEGFELVRHGAWTKTNPDALWGKDPSGMTLGILGLGRIGQALARRVASLGMLVIYHNRTPLPGALEDALTARWVSFDDLLRTSDVLTVHVPLTAETRHRIGAAELSQMKPGSFVINTARGQVFDEEALLDALRSGHIAGVGLDVFADEPNVPAELREHPRAFCLPHISSATAGTRFAMMRLCLDNVASVLAGGKPLTPVNAL